MIKVEIRCDVQRDAHRCHSKNDNRKRPAIYISARDPGPSVDANTIAGLAEIAGRATKDGWKLTELGWLCPVCQNVDG